MSGTWSLHASGAQLTTLGVLLAPTLTLTRAQTVTLSRTGAATATGDARYQPAPVRLRVYIEEASAAAALEALRTLRGHVEAADELRYDDGTTYVTRSGLAQALEPRLDKLGTGYIEAELVWLPTGPQWVNCPGPLYPEPTQPGCEYTYVCTSPPNSSGVRHDIYVEHCQGSVPGYGTPLNWDGVHIHHISNVKKPIEEWAAILWDGGYCDSCNAMVMP